MSDNAKQPKPAKPPKQAAEGVVAELSEESIKNLAGYFDVLIQMDFAIKLRNERNRKDGINQISTTDAGTSSQAPQRSSLSSNKARDSESSAGKEGAGQ